MQTSMHHNDCTLSVKRKDDLVARTTNGQIVGPGPLDSAAGFCERDRQTEKPQGFIKIELEANPD